MLFDAAQLFCNFSWELAQHGLQLQDSHGWNIMFRNTEPIYVDFSSIVPLGASEPWMPFHEFINCFLHPIQMIAHRQADYAFYLLGTRNWVDMEATLPCISAIERRILRKLKTLKYARWERVHRSAGPDSAKKLIHLLEKEISKYKPTSTVTRWSEYSNSFPSADEQAIDAWNDKQKNVHKILSSLQQGTLLDLGCNTGWYSILAAKMGFNVFGMDTDRTCIENLYKRAKTS